VRARKRCPTVVLVVAPDAEVASWAAEPIDLGLGLGTVRPLVIGASSVPEVMDAATAEKEVELAVLSAVAHGNGPNGVAVLAAALVALGQLDQMIYNMLREPMRRALEALVMERQTENKATFPPFIQRLIDGSRLDGIREGELEGKRDALLRLIARVGVPLNEEDRARIVACTDGTTLDRWFDNVLGAKSIDEVLS
jgi:hypothetical protein